LLGPPAGIGRTNAVLVASARVAGAARDRGRRGGVLRCLGPRASVGAAAVVCRSAAGDRRFSLRAAAGRAASGGLRAGRSAALATSPDADSLRRGGLAAVASMEGVGARRSGGRAALGAGVLRRPRERGRRA